MLVVPSSSVIFLKQRRVQNRHESCSFVSSDHRKAVGQLSSMSTKRGYKVTDVGREKKVGVAAASLRELLDKSCGKLGVSVGGGEAGPAECRVFVAADGTAVEDDEYLATLPAQTLLVLLRPNETMVTDFNYLYDLIRSTNIDYLTAGSEASDFLSTNIKEKFRVFQKYIASASNDKTLLSGQAEDPVWFQGLDPSERTKEASMTKRVKDRMRGYYYKTKTALQNSNVYIHSKKGIGKIIIDAFLSDLKQTLDRNKCNGCYFDRKAREEERLCSEHGQFGCNGLWNIDVCPYEGDHIINPYRSREERIIFQTWNFDHRIELSRSIIPKIIESVEEISKKVSVCENCSNTFLDGFIAFNKYYVEIFTKENLKLVHIVCHYKGKHLLESDVHVLCKACYGDRQ